jgi:hypothetical protein
MAFSISPHGIDPERKKQAADCAVLLDHLAQVLGAMAVGATIVFPPMATGLLMAAAVTPMLRRVFGKISADPPRLDFTAPVTARPMSLDPTLLSLDAWAWEGHALISRLPTLVLGCERSAAYLDAWLCAVERAMGAHEGGSFAAVDLRIAEAKRYATLARSSLSTTLHAAEAIAEERHLLQRLLTAADRAVSERQPESGAQPQVSEGSLASYVAKESLDAALAAGLDAEALSELRFRVSLLKSRQAALLPSVFRDAMRLAVDLAEAMPAAQDFAGFQWGEAG